MMLLTIFIDQWSFWTFGQLRLDKNNCLVPAPQSTVAQPKPIRWLNTFLKAWARKLKKKTLGTIIHSLHGSAICGESLDLAALWMKALPNSLVMVWFLLLKITDFAIGEYILCNTLIYTTVSSRLSPQMADHAKSEFHYHKHWSQVWPLTFDPGTVSQSETLLLRKCGRSPNPGFGIAPISTVFQRTSKFLLKTFSWPNFLGRVEPDMPILTITCIFFTFNGLTLTSEMHFVKFHPEVASCLLSRGKRKYAPLGMRLIWKYIRNYFLVYQLISHVLSYLQNYKEFKAKILDLQPEKYGLWAFIWCIKKCRAYHFRLSPGGWECDRHKGLELNNFCPA